MKTLTVLLVLLLAGCNTPRLPQANDCEVLHKGDATATQKCVEQRKSLSNWY